MAPNGTKYYADHLTSVRADTVVEFGPEVRTLSTSGQPESQTTVEPRVGPVRWYYPRQFATMAVSRVEDRFGNWVVYNYSGPRLNSITASDGRHVAINWRSDAPLISSIVVQPGPNQRVWSYAYESIKVNYEAWGAHLAKVTLPDGTYWQYPQYSYNVALPTPYGCSFRQGTAETIAPLSFTVKHPTGLQGTFTIKKKWYARSYVPSVCWYESGTAQEVLPPMGQTSALIEKKFSGAGIPTSIWTYTYAQAQGSTTYDACSGTGTCLSARWVDVTDPDGARVRYTIGTRWGIAEGRTVAIQTFDRTGAMLRTESMEYADPNGGPFPARIGTWIGGSLWSSADAQEQISVVKRTVTTQDGRAFETNVNVFDVFGRPLKLSKSSSPAP